MITSEKSAPYLSEWPPELTVQSIDIDERLDSNVVSGWEKLDQWANLNHSAWRAIKSKCEFCKLDEIDTLRMLAETLLLQNIEMSNRLIGTYKRTGIPSIVWPDSETVS